MFYIEKESSTLNNGNAKAANLVWIIRVFLVQVFAILITYKSLKLAEKALREINAEINSLSKGDYKISLRTIESMMILFTSEVTDKDISARMKGIAYNDATYLLFSIDQILAGFLEPHILEWLAIRIHRAKRP